LVFLKIKDDLKKLKEKLTKEDIIKTGEGFIFISRTKKDEQKEDFGTFAF
jgi:hypothetical protein